MNTFQNVGSNYRAVIFTVTGIMAFSLAEVDDVDDAGSHQVVDDGQVIIGLHKDVLRLNMGGGAKSDAVPWAHPVVQACLKQHAWLKAWLLGDDKTLPVPRASWRVTKIRRAAAEATCRHWGLPAGVAEAVAANAGFSFRINDRMTCYATKVMPAGVLLYGLRQPGGRAERIARFEGVNMVHGYPYLVEVCPKEGSVVVHSNHKNRQRPRDWVARCRYSIEAARRNPLWQPA